MKTTKQQTNKVKTTKYIKMASTDNSTLIYVPIWSIFLPHILYTHLQSKCSLHVKNKYIYTQKKKLWTNNLTDKTNKNPSNIQL